LITTNATIIARAALVMGRGIARLAKERFPGLDVALGKRIQAVWGNQGVTLTRVLAAAAVDYLAFFYL
jgi:hypothetical protein